MDFRVPAGYIVSRDIQSEVIPAVLQYLSITPVCSVLVTDTRSIDIARQFSESVIRVASEDEAISLALKVFEETNQPVLVIGSAGLLKAIHADGNTEELSIGIQHVQADNQVQ